MKTLNGIKSAALAFGLAFTLACGYSSKPAPATAGNVPTIAQLSPNSASAGGAAFTLTVNGSSFNSNAVVNWNGTAMTGTTYVSGKQLMVNVPASSIASAATVNVTVTNPGTVGTGPYGGGGTTAETSAAMTFTIN
jgi:IPT/TIG domain